tara:strand:- start:4175 stop:5158 length:984 start_codon:yes stop_codon:yes gene_type:complete
MEKKLIIFGPWVGEFSYEISWWIPEIREIKNKKHPNNMAIACGFEGRKGLYNDFIHEYIPHPIDLENVLKYPSGAGEHIGGRDIMPPIFMEYIRQIELHYQDECDEIIVYSPDLLSFGGHRNMSHNPPGEYIPYESKPNFDKIVNNKINSYFKNQNKEVISLVAKSRYRKGEIDNQNWNPINWIILIEKIITELNLNIILIDIPQRDNKGGSIDFKNTELYSKYKDNILCFNVEGKDSIDTQFSILKNTKCSLYGATGAAVLPFFLNTPVFTQQTKENGERLNFEWQKKLTNNHQNVKIFNKYSIGKIFNSPVDELFNEFKKFYEEI